MFHPYAQVYGYVDEPLDSNRGPPLCLWSKEFYETDLSRGFRPRLCVISSAAASDRSPKQSSARPTAGCPGAPTIIVYSGNWPDGASALSAICEDLPEEHNRVTLDPVLKDGHGIPAPKVDYTISENSQRMMQHGIARAKEILAAAGATNVGVQSPILNGGWHLLGTARMGTDPERSVVNEWGRCHDVKNMFIVDGSIFVTSGGVNPTCTIQALALYIADA